MNKQKMSELEKNQNLRVDKKEILATVIWEDLYNSQPANMAIQNILTQWVNTQECDLNTENCNVSGIWKLDFF